MTWVVTAEESSGSYSQSGGYVPTLGSKAQAIDLYRTLYFQGGADAINGISLTDVHSAAALAKLIEGPVQSFSDLAQAEMALQALLLTESPQVHIPALKVRHDSGFWGYHRVDKGFRSDLAFALFDFDNSWDFLTAHERVDVEDGMIVGSSDLHSGLVGQKLSNINMQSFLNSSSAQSAPLVLSDLLSAPSYLSSGHSEKAARGSGFQKRFYSNLNHSWKRSVEGVPPIVCSFSLPPLIALVLNEAVNRENIPDTIRSLRGELAGVRSELLQLNKLATHAMGQAEIEARVARLEASFLAIVPESRLSGSERRARNFFVIQRVVAPVLRYAAGFFMNNGGSINQAFNVSAGAVESLVKTEKIVDRSLTASKFAKLIKTDSIQHLVRLYLSEPEILSIEASLRSS